MMLFGKRVVVTVWLSADQDRTINMNMVALDKAIVVAPLNAVTSIVDVIPEFRRKTVI
jgi:SH3-like domain-containing protein